MTNTEKQKTSRRIAEARESGLDIVLDAYPKIVGALVKQAEGGSCPHAKLVFELLDPATKRGAVTPDEEEPPRQSLAEYLIEQLQLEPPPDSAADGACPGSTSGA